jgi:hypothetical protein
LTLENRRWKAFLRLRGETLVEKDDEILNEFKGFVDALKQAGVDYSIIVNVEGGPGERFLGQTQTIRAAAHAPAPEGRRYESSEAGL